MSYAEYSRPDARFTARPRAYDPVAEPEYFVGVLPRRLIAFVIDLVILALPLPFVAFCIFVSGLLTFGLGWLLFWALPSAMVVWAVLYYGLCFGSRASATLGMRAVDLQMRSWNGAPAYFLLGAVHAVIYWISVSALTPLIVLVALLNARRRMLHDIVLGTVVVNSEARAAAHSFHPVRPL
jgi:uncharacterized RDD family membrane protein YckC